MKRIHLAAFGAAALAVSAASCLAAEPGATGPGKTLGFGVTAFNFAIDRDRANCPNGFALTAKPLYLQSVSPDERARLEKPENLKELQSKAFSTPDGTDLCKALDTPRPPQYSPVGMHAPGMALDGTTDGHATDTTCGHEKFTAPDGSLVDNQMFRVLGCLSDYVGKYDGDVGYLEALRNHSFAQGDSALLFEVTGIHDLRNDPDIQIGVYASPDPMMVDSQGKIVPDASLTITGDKKYQATVKGRIVDGVIESDPFDFTIPYRHGGGTKEYILQRGRIRIVPQSDDKASGMVAGYLTDALTVGVTKPTKQAGTETVGYDCPSFAQAITRYADGPKDPVSGKCTGLSSAWEMTLVPVFVIHPKEPQKSADASHAKQP